MGRKSLIAFASITVGMAAWGAEHTHENFEKEVRAEKAAAVVAVNYLAKQPEITKEFEAMIVAKQVEIDHVAAVAGADCMKLVLGVKPQTIEDITATNNCELNKDAIKETKNLYGRLNDQKTSLMAYVATDQFGFEPILENAKANALNLINDAGQANWRSDLVDGYHSGEPFSVIVGENGSIVTAGMPDEYNLNNTFWYAFGVAIPGLLTVGAIDGLRSRTKPGDGSIELQEVQLN